MSRMKVAMVALLGAATVFGQEVETDLPQEKKGERLPYYHDDTPLNAIYSIYSDIFIHKWLDAPHDGREPIPQAEQDKISDTYIAHWKQQAADATDVEKKAVALNTVCEGLIYRGRWAELEELSRQVIASGAKSQQQLSRAWNGLIEAQLGAGKKAEALATIKEFLSKNLQSGGYYNGGRSRHTSYHYEVYHAKYWLEEDRWMDDLQMPRYTSNRAFPEAQKATYQKEGVKCATIAIKLEGVKEDDARVRLLKQKLRKRGFEFTVQSTGREGAARTEADRSGRAPAARYPVTIALDPNAKVEKAEGYTLVATKQGCDIRARDLQGVLWGIVSFIQILDPKHKAMRVCDIEDWPDCARRGYYGRNWTSSCEFAVFNKMNYVTHKPHYLSLGNYSPMRLFITTEECKAFNDFGLEFYGGCGNHTMDVAWPVCWNVTTAMIIDELKKWAKCGLNVYYPYDDARYWESSTYTKEERESGLKPSETDAKRIAEIYRAIKAEYPNFKMQFCPPFYWGPRAGHPYPDNRDKYLRSIAEYLPKEIDVIWTGERVGSHTKGRGDCQWYSNLIGRKPSLFQNKTGPHRYQSYICDRTPWDKWYYPGFVTEDMAGIQKNSSTPQECPQISSLADYLWNVKAYDRTKSIKRGLDNYAGKDVFETLDPAHTIACEYDKYHRFGTLIRSVRFKTLEQIEADYKTVMDATAKAKGLMVTTNQFERGMGSWNFVVAGMKCVLREKKKNPDPRVPEAKFLANDLADAVNQCGYKEGEKDAWFFDGYMFDDVNAIYVPSKSRRDWHPIATSRIVSNYTPGVSGKVTLPLKKEAKKPLKAVLAGYGALSNFKIEVNGKVAYTAKKVKPVKGEGDAPARVEFELPAELFQKGDNEINLTHTGNGEMNIVYLLVRS